MSGYSETERMLATLYVLLAEERGEVGPDLRAQLEETRAGIDPEQLGQMREELRQHEIAEGVARELAKSDPRMAEVMRRRDEELDRAVAELQRCIANW